MDIGFQLPTELQDATKDMVFQALEKAFKEARDKNSFPPYMTQQEASIYLHVAPSTFNQWKRNYHIPTIHIAG